MFSAFLYPLKKLRVQDPLKLNLPGDSAHLQYGTQQTLSRMLFLGSLFGTGFPAADPLAGCHGGAGSHS